MDRFREMLAKRSDPHNQTASSATSTSLSPNKLSLRQRLVQSCGIDETLGRKTLSQAPVALHLTHDHQPEVNPTHQRLPEEHRTTWQRSKYERDLSRKQPKRILNGPIPRRLPTNLPDSLADLQRDLNAALLTPIEADVWYNLSRTGRAAYFRPIQVHRPDPSAPINEYILVHITDLRPLQRIQDMARNMPEEDKHKLLQTMHEQVSSAHVYTLRQLLFRPDLRVTASLRGTGVESQTFIGKEMRRPSSVELIRAGESGFRESWIVRHSTGFAQRAPRDPVTLATVRQRARDFARRPFNTVERETKKTCDHPSSLRGGGGSDDGDGFARLNSNRSKRALLDVLRCAPPTKPLAEKERVPKALWWLAGGCLRPGKEIPTAGELRKRRRVEIENRERVGFWGTLFGKNGALTSNKKNVCGTTQQDDGARGEAEEVAEPPGVGTGQAKGTTERSQRQNALQQREVISETNTSASGQEAN